MSQNLSSVAVVIGALRVNFYLFIFLASNWKLALNLCLFVLVLFPVSMVAVMTGLFPVFLGRTSTKQRIVSSSRTQGSACGESRTSDPSISSLTLYH